MRTWTTAEERAYDTTEPKIEIKVEIEDGSATLQNWCDLDGACFVESIAWSDNLDQPMASGEAVIDWQRTEYDGMSPFVTGGRYEGYLAEWREIVISTRVYPHGADASAFSWREVFRGRVDKYDLSSSPGKILFRDKIGAELMDQQLMSVEAYGDDDGAKDIEDVIGDILTDHDKTSATLETPVATAYQVKRYNQTKMRLLQALRNLAFTIGWDLRSKWNESGSAFKLTLYEPDRTISTADHTISPGFIRSWNEFGSSVENIRNAVRVWYGDITDPDADGEPGRKSVVRTATTSPAHDLSGSAVASSSIAKYGWRLMEIAEASSSVVSDATAATNLADYAIADLASPTVIGHCTLAVYFWPVELNDYYDFTADGVRLGSDTKAAIHGYSHSLSPGGGASTELFFRAKPGLGPAAYFSRSGNAILQPDDKAPDAPTVALRQTPLGVLAEVVTTRLRDFDRVLFHVGTRSDFTPNAESLVQSSRSTTYAHQLKTGVRREWLKVQIRDLVGNISATAGPFPLVAKKTDTRQLSQALQAKTMLGLLADYTVSVGDEPLIFDKYQAGEFLGDYNLQTGQFYARESGTYRFVLGGQCSTAMTEGTDFTVSLIRDPDGDAEEVARAVFVSGSGTDEAFSCDVFVPLDADDEVEVEVVDLGGTFTSITFRADYCTFKAELVGTQARSKPYPFVEADPAFIDHGPAGTFSAKNGQCRAVFRCSNGEILFTNGAAGDAYPARLHRNVVDTAKARSITVSGSTDYWFAGVAEDEDRNLYLATSKVDATASYALRRYGQDLAQDWVSTDLGSSIVPLSVCYAPCANATARVYLGTDEGAAGKVRSINRDTGAAVAASADLGGPVNSMARLHPDDADGGLVVAQIASATSPDIVALEAGDVTTEVWRIQLDTAVTPQGFSTSGGAVKSSPEFDLVYMIGGPDEPRLFAIDATGTIVWSEDLGDHSSLADITGCVSLDVHPTTGDVAVLCLYDNTTDGTTDLDCIVFDREANARWTWRGLYDVDPSDDPLFTSSEVGHKIAFATDGAIWLSNGDAASSVAKVFRPYAEIPDDPPSILASELLADFDPEQLPLSNGSAVAAWPSKRGTGGWRLTNSTAAEQPKMRARWEAATVDAVARTQTKFAAVELDGTERLICNEESTLLPDGAICVLVCEPVDTTGDYFSGYPAAGSGSNTSIKLENTASRLTLTVNEDIGGADETVYTHASLAGLQVVGARAADHTTAGLWLSNAKPNGTAADSGSDASPDNNVKVRLGQASSASGDWFAGWVYRWIWVRPAGFSASKVCSIMHWARHYYEVPEVAVEDIQSAPGNTIADVNSGTPVQYFGVDTNDDHNTEIAFVEGRNVSGGCLIGVASGVDTDPHLKLIPNSLGAETWHYDAANTHTFAWLSSGVRVDESGDFCWTTVKSDGTVGSANQMILAKISMADGTTDAQYVLDHGATASSGQAHTLSVDRVNNEIYAGVNASGDELKRHIIGTGTAATSGNDAGLGFAAGEVSPDGDYYCAMGSGSTCYLAKWTLPLTGTATLFDGYSADRTQADGTDTTNDFNYFIQDGDGATMNAARDAGSNKVWFAPGDFSVTLGQEYGGRYDPDVATVANRVDLEIRAVADANFTLGTYNKVKSHCVDQYGYVYFLVANGPNFTDDYDIVRYQPDGTFDLSFGAEGATTPQADATYGIPIHIGVNEDDQVFVGTTEGYVQSWTQT